MFVKVVIYLTVAFLTCLFLLQTVLSIKCWKCRSDVDPQCADPFDNTSFPIHDCSNDRLSHLPHLEAPTMCRKTRQKVDGKWRYIRDCAWLGIPGVGGDERICNITMGTYNIFVEYCNCQSKDGCNSANALRIPSNLYLLFGFLFSLISLYFIIRPFT